MTIAYVMNFQRENTLKRVTSCYKCGNCLLPVVPPSDFEEAKIQKLIRARMKNEGSAIMPLEGISSRSIFWMPYYRIRFEYERSEEDVIREFGKTAESETAMNAMFCGCTLNENELLALFRPNYLKYNMTTYSPRLNEAIAPIFPANFEVILQGFLQRINEFEKELNELRSALNKHYVNTKRHSLILPVLGSLKENDRLTKKIAKLSALANVSRMCLNLSEKAETIKILQNSMFYYPTVVAAAEQKQSEAKRFLVIDLVKKGLIHKSIGIDDALTLLCNKNDACNKVLVEFFNHIQSSTNAIGSLKN